MRGSPICGTFYGNGPGQHGYACSDVPQDPPGQDSHSPLYGTGSGSSSQVDETQRDDRVRNRLTPPHEHPIRRRQVPREPTRGHPSGRPESTRRQPPLHRDRFPVAFEDKLDQCHPGVTLLGPLQYQPLDLRCVVWVWAHPTVTPPARPRRDCRKGHGLPSHHRHAVSQGYPTPAAHSACHEPRIERRFD
jgi:hypothetical protein